MDYDGFALYLHRQIAAAGIPIVGVSDGGANSSPRFRIDFDPSATPAQRTQATAIAASLDTSSTGASAALLATQRATGDFVFMNHAGPSKALRAVTIGLFNELQVTMNKVNELVTFANAHGGSITPLSVPTKAQALAYIRDRISSGDAD